MRQHRLNGRSLSARYGSLAVIFLSGWVVGNSAIGATPVPESTTLDIQANLFTSSAQEQAALDSSPTGETLMVWASRRQERGSYGVYARQFDALGQPLTGEIHINETLRGAQHRPAVALTPKGGAWVVWESTGQDGSGSAVVARRLNAQLEAIAGEIAVNVERTGDQGSAAVATDTQGRALIAWSSQTSRDTAAIRARHFGADGQPLGGELALSADFRDSLPTVAALPGDRFLVAWARHDRSTGHHSVVGRFVGADGTLAAAELELSPRSESAIEPAVAADAEGRFVAAWLTDRDFGYAVALRRFDARGVALGDPQILAEPSTGWKSGVAVAMAPDGRFAVSYNSDGEDGDGEGLFAQLFAADGRPIETRRVSGVSEGRQAATLASGARRAAWTAGDVLAFAWNGDSGHGDSSAANLTLRIPAQLQVAASRPASRHPAQAADVKQVSSQDIEAAIPPIWNPDSAPLARLAENPLVGGDFGFEAVPNTGWTPPDPEIAVGPDRIVVMTNGEIAAFDKQGVQQWSDEIENAGGFWGDLGADNFVFDPEVAYDPHDQRFFVMANERSDDVRSFFLLGVSKDATPDDENDWHKYRIDVTGLSDNDIDSPNMSLNRDYVLLTADFFGPDKYLLFIIDKASILEGGAPVTTSELITGAGQQSMGVPVVTSDVSTLYIVQSTEFGINDTVILHAITDPFTNYMRQTFTVSVPEYRFPASPPQMGTSARPILFEPRFWSTAEQGGSIWAVHHVNNSRSRARWYEFDLAGWPDTDADPFLVQSGEIDLGDAVSTFFPSLQVDAAGNAAITYARSASNEFISMGRAVRAAGDPLNTFRPAQVVQISTNPNTGNRWGDYSGTWADPVLDNTFWGHHQFLIDGGNSWRTWVARYDLRPEPMLLTVNPPETGVEVSLAVTGATPGATVVFYETSDGTGLTEIPGQQVVLSLENAVEVATAVAGGDGVAATNAILTFTEDGLVQAAEDNHTTNWVATTGPATIFADGFESGNTSAWTTEVP